MRRIFSVLLVLTFIAVLAAPASAVCGNLRHKHGNYSHTHYGCTGHKHGRSFWQKHRDKLTTAGGVLGGAMIGGLAGGKKGAAIGALAGGGGAAVYTYKIRKGQRKGARY